MTKESRDELLERILEETARRPYKPSARPAAKQASAQVNRQPAAQAVKPQTAQPKAEQQTQVFSNAEVNAANPGVPVQQTSAQMQPDLTQMIPAQRDFDMNSQPQAVAPVNAVPSAQEVTQQEMQSAAEKIQKIKQEKAAAAKAAIMQKAEIENKRMMQQNTENENSQIPPEPPVFTVNDDDEKVNIVTDDEGFDYEESAPKTSLWVKIHNLILYLMYLAFVVIVLFTFIFSFASVSGDSMKPTLSDGEKLLAVQTGYKPQRGDVVIIDSKTAGLLDENGNVTENEALNCMISKRIIAVGGDTIDFDFENGTVTVNGEVLNESYISEPTTRNDQAAFEYPLTIPQGYVFVLGDNRNISMDSRHAKIGLVPEDEVTGKAVLKVYPFGSFGVIE